MNKTGQVKGKNIYGILKSQNVTSLEIDFDIWSCLITGPPIVQLD